MRKQILATVVVGVLALGLAGNLAWAAGAVSVNVPFSFIVKDKEMPAGRYEIRAEGNDESRLAIRSNEGGGAVFALVLERLADIGAKEPKVVFDKTEDGKTYLSEVHMVGKDGFLVGIAGGKEKHVTLSGKE
ncbi:MAG: hypothetical protein A2Y78_04130 [Acidobacteria bacterium RBG_13_68_16]|jgi:hypothetical protein|nr:MAG: hypothetical protein A2Y78_04130 [Acidobacteria bacterium RBG_13_68_16]